MAKFMSWFNTVLTVCLRFVFAICLVLMCIIFSVEIIIVLMRYVMGVGFLELQDLVTYAFATIAVLSIPLAYWKGQHVRVDVLRSMMKPKILNLVEKICSLVFVLPVFGLLLVNAWPLVYNSFSILEGSRETGGLGGLFLVKGTVLLMCVLVMLLAVYAILKPSPQEKEYKHGN